MPATAMKHFREDIARARIIVTHADQLPTDPADKKLLRADLLRSAWMFAVGALDAYFCDAYTDIVAATIISKSRHPAMILSGFFYDIKFPVRAILEPYTNANWRWRMAARKMMEWENVLSLKQIQELFNRFLRHDRRFYRDLVLDSWIAHPESSRRLFGITRTGFAALDPADKGAARVVAKKQMDERFRSIFQRRHDCIHNCDRPKVSPQELASGGTVVKVIQDVEFLVGRCDEHIAAEFRQFLGDAGCPPAIVNQAGY